MNNDVNIDPMTMVNYLGLDYKKEGGLVKITCPFHNDTNPSMVLYPDHAYCYACGQGASLPWLAVQVKGITYPKALEELGMEVLPVGERKSVSAPIYQPMSFCERPKKEYAEAFKLKHEQCKDFDWCVDHMDDDEGIYDFVMWVASKCLDEQMKDLDWRWHDGTVFKNWGKGIVIPYKCGDNIVYERFRAWDKDNHKFEKPKGPYDVSIQPYLATFRPNNAVFIVEGESDSASVYAHGCSALGIPGAVAKKAINTVVAFIADRDYIDTIVCCGDNDQSGQRMNQLIREAVMEICPKKNLVVYTVESEGEKSDLNDDHVNGLFKPPVEWTANYGENYNRQPWADKDFADFCEKFETDYVPCAENTSDTWLKGAVVYKKKGTTIHLNGGNWKKVGEPPVQVQPAQSEMTLEPPVEEYVGKPLVVTGCKLKQSNMYKNETYYHVFMKDKESGKGYRSCPTEHLKNFVNWKPVIDNFNKPDVEEILVYGWKEKGDGVVNADSRIKVKVVKKQD